MHQPEIRPFLIQLLRFSRIPAVLLMLPAAYNYYFDPFGVIRQALAHQVNDPNVRYIKTAFVAQHPDSFNAFVFGNSRSDAFLLDSMAPLGPELRWFNNSYANGLPAQHLEDLQMYLAHGVTIKKVIIGIDGGSFYQDADYFGDMHLYRGYKNRWNPYLSYFLVHPKYTYSLREHIAERRASPFFEPGKFQVLLQPHPPGYRSVLEQWIDAHPEEHRQDPTFLPIKPLSEYQPLDCTVGLEDLLELLAFCRAHGIETLFYTHPTYLHTYLRDVQTGYLEALHSFGRHTAFYNFSGVNALTRDPTNYAEWSHYRAHVGEMIRRAVVAQDSSYLVTPETVDSVVDELEREAALEAAVLTAEPSGTPGATTAPAPR